MRFFVRTLPLVLVLLFMGSFAFAQGSAEAAEEGRSGITTALIALAAAIAIGLTAFATAYAQARIGAAGAGTIAERPESSGTIIIMLALPETLVIFGFIISVIILLAL